MDKVTLIRSMHHTMKNHKPRLLLRPLRPRAAARRHPPQGHAQSFPAYGSVVSRLAPSEGEIPPSSPYPFVIRDGSVTPPSTPVSWEKRTIHFYLLKSELTEFWTA